MTIEVGVVAKAHGLRGELVVMMYSDSHARLQPGTLLSELEVASAKPFPPVPNRWLVRFVGVDDRNAAELLHGKLLKAEPIDDPDAFYIHDLIGLSVFDQRTNAVIGEVKAVEANPAADLLVLKTGALIPMTFVKERSGSQLVVNLPEGLLDL